LLTNSYSDYLWRRQALNFWLLSARSTTPRTKRRMDSIETAYQRFARIGFPLPSEEQIAALERRLGVELPADYRKFISEFNGGIFDEPEIETDHQDCRGDALTFLHGINSGDEETELGAPSFMALFEENDPPILIPIGYTALGGILVLVVEEEGRGAIVLKQAFGGFFHLADHIEELFGLLQDSLQG
jgi:hypothetical protein